MIAETEIVLRLVLGAILGAVVGLERERQNQFAGLRTHVILVVGATLCMVLSINLSGQFRNWAPNGDPSRLAAQVVSGIGFLGAGAILRMGPNIKGLTTATTLWSMAIVGLAVGAGYYLIGVAATALLLFALVLLNRIESKIPRPFLNVSLFIAADDREGLIAEIRKVVQGRVEELSAVSIEKDLVTNTLRLEAAVEVRDGEQLDKLTVDLSGVKGVRGFRIR